MDVSIFSTKLRLTSGLLRFEEPIEGSLKYAVEERKSLSLLNNLSFSQTETTTVHYAKKIGRE